MRNMEFFFSGIDNTLGFSQEYAIDELINDLPSNLKPHLFLFLYNEAIVAIPFLQNRCEKFYLSYLQHLTPLKFIEGANIIKERTKSEEMFFLLSGEALNTVTKRIFTRGALIGETDIIFKRDRTETYIALSTVYLLMYDLNTVQAMLRDFPDIKEDLTHMAQ
jgi:CRP-like cAMP-binding protein